MGKYTFWPCAVVIVSLAISTVGHPEEDVIMNHLVENSLTAINLQQSQIEGKSPIPLYAPIAFMEDEQRRVKRHLLKKKKGKKGGNYSQYENQPPIVIVNHYGRDRGQYGGGHGWSAVAPVQQSHYGWAAPVKQHHGWAAPAPVPQHHGWAAPTPAPQNHGWAAPTPAPQNHGWAAPTTAAPVINHGWAAPTTAAPVVNHGWGSSPDRGVDESDGYGVIQPRIPAYN